MRRKKGTRTLTQPSLLPQSLARQLFSDGSRRSDKEVGGGGGGGWSSRPWDKRGGRLKIFFRPFGPQFGLEIRGRAPSLDPPLLFIYHYHFLQQEAEESDAKWGAESQKQQKSGRGLKREGAHFLPPFFFHDTVFPLCCPHYLKAWNEQRISVWTHVEILVELVLVRVHTGWFSSLLSPPRFMALIRASIGQLLSLL